MSTKEVGTFICAANKTPGLNERLAAAPKTVAAWIAIAKEEGIELSTQDFVAFVEEVTGSRANVDNAVAVLLAPRPKPLSDAELESVSGGVVYTTAAAGVQIATQVPALLSINFGNLALHMNLE